MEILIQSAADGSVTARPFGRWTAVVAATLLVLAGARACSSAQPVDEYEVKAAFLARFASFVEWPADSATGPLCIGIVGEDPFGRILDQAVSAKNLLGRPVTIKRLRANQRWEGCQVLFLSASEAKRIPSILSRVAPGTLTVGESPGFCESGGVIAFEMVENLVRFEINLEAAERAQLKISSKLISVARVARREGR